MSFRSIIISNPASLSVKHNNLLINNGKEFLVPIEDISVLIIEGVAVNLNNKLLSKLSEFNVATIICDNKHFPSTVVMPLNSHHRALKVLREQLSLTASFNKRIWQKIIAQKLHNQGQCLELLNLNGAEFLKKLSCDVESGDKGNKEAIGAKYYFKSIFGEKFIRGDDMNCINSALNYGYAIFRSAIARTLVMYGFNPCLGVHHCNELNQYNLADDFIEPFRAMVDLWVYKNIKEDDVLIKRNRIELVNLLNYECIIEDKNHSILNAIDKMVASYKAAVNKKDFRLLKVPKIKDLEYHAYE